MILFLCVLLIVFFLASLFSELNTDQTELNLDMQHT